MTPYICVVKGVGDDEGKTFLRVSHPNTPSLDIEMSPFEMLLLSTDLMIQWKQALEHKNYRDHTGENDG